MSKISHRLYLAVFGILIIVIVALVSDKATETVTHAIVESKNHRFAIFPFFAEGSKANEIAQTLDSLIAASLEKHESIELIPAAEFMPEVNSASDHQRWTNRLLVSYVLEGAVKLQGDNVRITVQLLDGVSDSHVWAKTYEIKTNQVELIAALIGNNIVSMVNR